MLGYTDYIKGRPGFDHHTTVNLASTDQTPPAGSAFFRAVYVGGAGDVVVQPADGGVDVTYKSVPQGTYLWGNFAAIRKTNTTATLMIGLS